MRTRAVLFDLDGTLADTLEDIGSAANHALASLGLPTHPIEAYRPLVGEGAATLIRRAMPAGADALHAEALSRFRARYFEHLVDATRLYDGIPELLDHCAARGLALAVLSNKPDPATRALVQALLGRWPWAAVVGERPGVPKKPDPTAALAIAGELGVTPAACVVVGDGEPDIAVARAAGMRSIGAAWGFRSVDQLRAAGASVIAATPRDVLALLDP